MRSMAAHLARARGAARRHSIRPYPPHRRGWKRREEHPDRHRPIMLVLALNAVLGILLITATCVAVPAGVAVVALQAQDWMSTHTIDLPASGPLDGDLPQTTSIVARNGTLLTEIEDIHYGRRTFVPLYEMSRMFVLATMAVEDRRFYEHPGVDAV